MELGVEASRVISFSFLGADGGYPSVAMKRVRNRLIVKGMISRRCVGDERKELEVKEIDEVKEVKEWRAAGANGPRWRGGRRSITTHASIN